MSIMTGQARYFDGASAASHDANVTVRADRLDIEAAGRRFSWPFSQMTLAGYHARADHTLRLSCKGDAGGRLVITDRQVADMIVRRAPHLTGGFNSARAVRSAMWIGAGLLAAVLAGYIVLTVTPGVVAGLMPDKLRDRLGRQTEMSLVRGKRQCRNPAGEKALLRLASRVAAGAGDPPDFSIRVYDLNILNAFAVAGGRIVVTRKLIEKADSPDELAGIVAHELGHVYHRHPEAALVRLMGIQFFTTLLSGGASGNTISSLAGLATLLKYSRNAETQADSFAQKTLVAADIDPAGLQHFFKKIKKIQDKTLLGKIPSIFTTHPGTGERITKLTPLPPGKARPVLTPLQWRALKQICRRGPASGSDS